MAAETGNTYISETMKDSIEIPTTNLRFTTIYRKFEENVGKRFQRQATTGNSYLWLEIPKVNPAFSNMAS